ncbi:MAG: hypothetical protein LBD30_01955 [Verrucomicrobiales bacterium]|jgi:hypothetical protein|nr:hypothetical protein [Verrucomicrobiales bacterium]
MKTYLLILFLALTVSVHAVNVNVLDAERQIIPAPGLAATSGETLKLRLVSPSLPLTNGHVRLFQRGNSVAMPLPLTVSVAPEDNGVSFSVSVVLPAVNKLTAAFLSVGNSSKINDNQTLPLTIYPIENRKSTGHFINEKLKNGKIKRMVIVGGGNPAIALYFNTRGIEYAPDNRVAPDALTFIKTTVGGINKLPLADGDRASVIVFVSDSNDIPSIRTILTASGGAFTKVTLPILNDLETNPRSREIFFNLINEHLSRGTVDEN